MFLILKVFLFCKLFIMHKFFIVKVLLKAGSSYFAGSSLCKFSIMHVLHYACPALCKLLFMQVCHVFSFRFFSFSLLTLFFCLKGPCPNRRGSSSTLTDSRVIPLGISVSEVALWQIALSTSSDKMRLPGDRLMKVLLDGPRTDLQTAIEMLYRILKKLKNDCCEDASSHLYISL